MTEKEIQFEEQLNTLILLKALLIAEGEFDILAQKVAVIKFTCYLFYSSKKT